jgi:hypothetical protein
MSWKWATGIMLVALAGCHHHPPPFGCVTVGPAHASSDDFDDAAFQFYQIQCQLSVRCGSLSASKESDCESLAGDEMDRDTDWLAGARHLIQCGGLVFDPAEAQRCLAALAASSCYQAGAAEEACLKALVPQPGWVPTDGACQFSEECIDGDCVETGKNTCLGSCRPKSGPGQPCGNFAPTCATGSFCSEQLETGKCIDEGHPIGTVPEGGNCLFPDSTGTPEDWDDACQPGLRCRNQNVCTAQGGDGTICVDQNDCLPGFSCDGPIMQRGGTCRGTPANEGEPCAPDDSHSCAAGLVCFYDFGPVAPVCRAMLGEGASCGVDDYCADSLGCIGLQVDGSGKLVSPGTCGPIRDLGDSCATVGLSGCAGDAHCDPATAKCVLKRKQRGDDCQPGACDFDLFCNQGKCDLRLPDGADCNPPPLFLDDSPCAAGTGQCDPTTRKCLTQCQSYQPL